MKLTKREAHYRTKIIQELHLKKRQQLKLDKLTNESDYDYYNLYYKIRLYHTHKMLLPALSRAIAATAVSASELAAIIAESLENAAAHFNGIYNNIFPAAEGQDE